MRLRGLIHSVAPILKAAAMAAALAGASSAGPHARGILIPHLNPAIEYSAAMGVTYEGQSDLHDCEQAITEGQVAPDRGQVWWVMASFDDSPGPVDLAGAQFGFGHYDPSKISFINWAPCNDGTCELELPTDGWPGPNEGTAFTICPPRRTRLVELYWFAAYVYGPVSIELSVNPFLGYAAFADNAVPHIEDEVWDFGIMGFGEPGFNPCAPNPFRTGACCVGEDCTVVTRDQCEASGGRYLGDNTFCFPNPCREETVETSWGKLKDMYR